MTWPLTAAAREAAWERGDYALLEAELRLEASVHLSAPSAWTVLGFERSDAYQVQCRFRRAEAALSNAAHPIWLRLLDALSPRVRARVARMPTRIDALEWLAEHRTSRVLQRLRATASDRAHVAAALAAFAPAQAAFQHETVNCMLVLQAAHPRWWPRQCRALGGTLVLLRALDRRVFEGHQRGRLVDGVFRHYPPLTGFHLLALGQTTLLNDQLPRVLAPRSRTARARDRHWQRERRARAAAARARPAVVDDPLRPLGPAQVVRPARRPVP